ncbi:hypothetical protein C2G38_2255227 [Gigaspora rosea]|uniref:Uncharacterized protein n=1 Tax=Gigaspora rosea TaxID=44941 RepID=A0A397TYJ3_9GLOM|nr:hypothetical protein C2G38_2255227 [Gigaspora rosea]
MKVGLNGIQKVEKSECSYKQSRIAGHVVNLISLPSLNASEFIEKVIYGITKDSATNGYMIVIPDISSSHNTFFSWCQLCDHLKSTQDWTSGDEYIDKCIREFQLKATNSGYVVNLISLSSLNASEFIEKLEQYMQLSDSIVYGITKDTTTSGYMIVVPDEFNSIRNEFFGECKYCRQHNTFFAWCQLCDPWEAAQDWTSGDEYIDECIKKFQLKTTNHEEIIE